jgi:hypothetical protein
MVEGEHIASFSQYKAPWDKLDYREIRRPHEMRTGDDFYQCSEQ